MAWNSPTVSGDPDVVVSDGEAGNIQPALIGRLESLCREFNLPLKGVKQAARKLLGKEYQPAITLPLEAEKKWVDRFGTEDEQINPLDFLQKYWGIYMEEEILCQKDLILLDNSLFEAVKGYCKNHDLDREEHLPPPCRTRNRAERNSSYQADAADQVQPKDQSQRRQTGEAKPNQALRPVSAQPAPPHHELKAA